MFTKCMDTTFACNAVFSTVQCTNHGWKYYHHMIWMQPAYEPWLQPVYKSLMQPIIYESWLEQFYKLQMQPAFVTQMQSVYQP